MIFSNFFFIVLFYILAKKYFQLDAYSVNRSQRQEVCSNYSKFSITTGCIRKIPLNPPLQKGEEAGIPRLIEKLPTLT